MVPTRPAPLELDGSNLSLDPLFAVAHRKRSVVLSNAPIFLERLAASRAALEELTARGEPIYGVTTGFGDSCETSTVGVASRDLARNLYLYHHAGVGEPLSREETRAVLLCRLISLARGHSAVRTELLERLCCLLEEDALPLIPALGSVGASGDLTPLAYVAAALVGEGTLTSHTGHEDAIDFWTRMGFGQLELSPRETLAMMNGTSVMTGLAVLAVVRGERLLRLATKLTAFAWETLRGADGAFSSTIVDAKPHEGSLEIARVLREDLEGACQARTSGSRIQDRYSIRCAPQILGVVADVLKDARRYVEIELNSASDNPIIDPSSRVVAHGGNFYGGHVCHAMDSLKIQIANVADMIDRQLLLLCNPATNNGLPPNLIGVKGADAALHHGFKALQITTSALAAEAAKQSIPMSIFSRSTENHNQDKVSMGTIAARDAQRILDLTETSAMIHALALSQAKDLRGTGDFSPSATRLSERVRTISKTLTVDRALDRDVAELLGSYREDGFGLS